MKRNNPEPYHLSPFNINTGYIVFDIMAPFTNIVNLKYAYGRYSYLHYDNNWDFMNLLIKINGVYCDV
mgnify:CR=1 FL=1